LQKNWIGNGRSPKDKALCDSNILIAHLFSEEERFDEAKEVLAKRSLRYISIISIHEIGYYAKRMEVEEEFIKIKPKLHKFIKPLEIDQETCIQATTLRTMEKLPEVDALIAATAYATI